MYRTDNSLIVGLASGLPNLEENVPSCLDLTVSQYSTRVWRGFVWGFHKQPRSLTLQSREGLDLSCGLRLVQLTAKRVKSSLRGVIVAHRGITCCRDGRCTLTLILGHIWRASWAANSWPGDPDKDCVGVPPDGVASVPSPKINGTLNTPLNWSGINGWDSLIRTTEAVDRYLPTPQGLRSVRQLYSDIVYPHLFHRLICTLSFTLLLP